MKTFLTGNSRRLRLINILALLSLIFPLMPPRVKAQTEPAQSRQLVMDEKPDNQKRLALVIGNAKYQHVTPLKNSANDAADIANALRDLGFEVMSGLDQNKEQMSVLIRNFGLLLNKKGGVGLFFYAGHGVQSGGRNYLVPVDADIPVEDEIEFQAIDVNQLLAKFVTAKNDFNIVLLDACRNNPFAKNWSEFRSLDGKDGLAKIAAPTGTIMLYATEPGKTASDGTGRNGLFTESLLEQIKKPNVEFDSMMKTVMKNVQMKSNNKQNPYKEGSNYGDFYLAGTAAKPVPGKQPPVVDFGEDAAATDKDKKQYEAETWEIVKNSTDEQDLRDYLQGFPDGANAARAKARLEQILWNSLKNTKDKKALQSFLDEFPGSTFAATARIKLRQIGTEVAKETNQTNDETPVTPPAKPDTARIKLVVEPRTVKSKGKTAPAGKYQTRSNAEGMEMVYLPAGSFLMGSSERNVDESQRVARKDYAEAVREWFDNEKPQHRVTFAEGFWMGKNEVTQAQWTAVMGGDPKFVKSCDECPVVRVSWEDAKLFVQKLNEKNDGFEYRLPSEAEWEYAARGGTTGIFAGAIDEMAWHNGNAESTSHPVGTKTPNNFGIYDMNGNVAEWCEDIYSPTYNDLPADGSPDKTIGEEKMRVVRGGSWNNFPSLSRSAARDKAALTSQNTTTGFRVAAVQK